MQEKESFAFPPVSCLLYSIILLFSTKVWTVQSLSSHVI